MAERIEIELVLDDGSIKKGLATLKQDSESAGKSIKDSFSNAFKIDGLADLKAGFDLTLLAVNKVVDAVSAVGKAFIDLTLQGEEIKAINNQFAVLAQQAGLSGEALSSALVRAADGLVDTEDLLQASSQSIIELGQNASRLPEIFTLARQASAAFGGDILSRFDQISTAIATGNARQLKQIGLIVDIDAATKAYAKSIGKTAEELTLAERQQAALNAVLTKGEEAFKGIDTSARANAQNLQRLKVAYGEFFDTIATLFNEKFAPILTKALQGITSGLDLINNKFKESAGQTVSYGDQIKILEGQLASAEERLSGASKGGLGSALAFREATAEVEKLNAEIERLQQLDLKEASRRQTDILVAPTPIPGLTTPGVPGEGGFVGPQRFTSETVAAEDIATLQSISNGFFGVQQTIFATSEAAAQATEAAAKRMQVAFNGIGLAARNGLGTAVSAGFNQFGRAIATGQNALSAFGKAFLGAIGGVASQLGQMFILEGIALSLDPFAPPGLGVGLIAAGAGLATFGGLLSGFAGGGPAVGAAPSGGGGIVGGGLPTSTIGGDTPEQLQDKTTKVQIDVAGTVLDPIGVGQQIAQILNDTFSATGTRVVTA